MPSKIQGLIPISDVLHATDLKLRYLNDCLSGLEEHRALKEAVKAEITKRRYKLGRNKKS